MSKKILVIESDVPLAGSIAGALHARGVEVALARDAQSALEVARSERPDGIVVCAELTGGSGFLVCNKLRKDPELRAIPLLITSADATEETFEQHRRLKTRADAYLRKPFAIADLVMQLGGLAGVPTEAPRVIEEDDLLALDAAFDSIAQLEETPAPVEQPISAEDAEAAAALLADVPDVAEAVPVLATEAAPVVPAVIAVEPEAVAPSAAAAEAPSAELDSVRTELAASRRELERMKASVAALEQELAAEQARSRELEARLGAESTSRDQLRDVLAAAVALLDRTGA